MKLRNVDGALIVHDKLRANQSVRTQRLFAEAGAETMETPVGGCVLSAVERVFAITKARFKTWLQQQWGEIHGEMTVI